MSPTHREPPGAGGAERPRAGDSACAARGHFLTAQCGLTHHDSGQTAPGLRLLSFLEQTFYKSHAKCFPRGPAFAGVCDAAWLKWGEGAPAPANSGLGADGHRPPAASTHALGPGGGPDSGQPPPQQPALPPLMPLRAPALCPSQRRHGPSCLLAARSPCSHATSNRDDVRRAGAEDPGGWSWNLHGSLRGLVGAPSSLHPTASGASKR